MSGKEWKRLSGAEARAEFTALVGTDKSVPFQDMLARQPSVTRSLAEVATVVLSAQQLAGLRIDLDALAI